MSNTTNSSSMYIKIDPDLKEKAEPILDAIGLSFGKAFNLLLRQICLKQRLPFELPSEQLIKSDCTQEL